MAVYNIMRKAIGLEYLAYVEMAEWIVHVAGHVVFAGHPAHPHAKKPRNVKKKHVHSMLPTNLQLSQILPIESHHLSLIIQVVVSSHLCGGY